MPILQLSDKPTAPPVYPIGSNFQIARNAWSSEVISATVETARWSPTFGWVHTVAIGGRHPHWRVLFEYQILKQVVKPAAIAA